MSYKIESPLPVIEGGTGVRATTVYAVLCGGTTSTGPLQSIASVGTLGQVLTSNGAGALPTFQTGVVGEVSSLTGDTGGAVLPTAGNINVVAGNATLNSGSTVSFSGSGDTLQFNVTDAFDNTIIGKISGNLTLTGNDNTVIGTNSAPNLTSAQFNVVVGANSASGLTTGIENVVVGQNAAPTMSSASSNVVVGDSAGAAIDTAINNVVIGGAAASSLVSSNNVLVGFNVAAALSTGDNNVVIGPSAADNLSTGQFNVIIGQAAAGQIDASSYNVMIGRNVGQNYVTTDSSNICIGYGVLGVGGQSNELRIGNATGTGSGEINAAFISGIRGITPGAGDGIPVYIDSNGQLGTVGTINLSYTNVTTSPYVVLATDEYLSVDTSTIAITIQLPNAASLGRTYVIKDRTGNAATRNITVTTVGGAVNIDGATTFVMNTAFESVDVIGNGSTYEIF